MRLSAQAGRRCGAPARASAVGSRRHAAAADASSHGNSHGVSDGRGSTATLFVSDNRPAPASAVAAEYSHFLGDHWHTFDGSSLGAGAWGVAGPHERLGDRGSNSVATPQPPRLLPTRTGAAVPYRRRARGRRASPCGSCCRGGDCQLPDAGARSCGKTRCVFGYALCIVVLAHVTLTIAGRGALPTLAFAKGADCA
jgi:hypothetical protein